MFLKLEVSAAFLKINCKLLNAVWQKPLANKCKVYYSTYLENMLNDYIDVILIIIISIILIIIIIIITVSDDS